MTPLRGLLATLLIAGLGSVALADDLPELTPAGILRTLPAEEVESTLRSGVGKRVVEMPVKVALKDFDLVPEPVTLTDPAAKGLVELPIKKALQPTPAAFASRGKKVTPGAVDWHPSFADATRAARASGKPVLLFQLIGHLDEEFC